MTLSGASPTRPRTLVVSLRRLNSHAAWCSNYEFEDVIQAVDEVARLDLRPLPRFEWLQRIARSVAWRGRHPAFTRLNPGVERVRVERDFELMVFVCMNVWDLLYLNALEGWKDRCKTKICYMVEFYAGEVDQFDHFLRRLGDFDLVFQSFCGSVESIEKASGRPAHHAPLAADTLRFTPYPAAPPRVIDVLSIGRRAEDLHRALRRHAAQSHYFYSYDTLPGSLVRPLDSVEHREMYAALAKRCRYFVTYPAKFGDTENRGQSEVGARYFEGLAAGAVLLGKAPTASSFPRDFPWPDAVVEAAAEAPRFDERLAEILEDRSLVAVLGRRNAVHALRHHDWGHRWRELLARSGHSEMPALSERLERLGALAEQAERGEFQIHATDLR